MALDVISSQVAVGISEVEMTNVASDAASLVHRIDLPSHDGVVRLSLAVGG